MSLAVFHSKRIPKAKRRYVPSSPDSSIMVEVPALPVVGRKAGPGYAGDLQSVTWSWKYPFIVLPDGKIVTYGQSLARNDLFYWWDDPTFAASGNAQRTEDYSSSLLDGYRAQGRSFGPTEFFKAVDYAKGVKAGAAFTPGAASPAAVIPAAAADASAPQLPASLSGQTWNDGTYTYVVKSPTEALVVETNKTFTPATETWGTFVTNLTAAAPSLKSGKAVPAAAGTPVKKPVIDEKTMSGVAPFYKKPWFIYTGVGVGVLGIVGAIVYSGRKK